MTIAIKIKTNWKRELNETKLIEINRLLRSKTLRCAIKNKNKTRQGINKKTGEKLVECIIHTFGWFYICD